MPAVTREMLVTYGCLEIADVEAGNGIYNLEASQDSSWIAVGIKVAIYGCTNAVNNGVFTVTGFSGTEIVTNNAASVVEAASPGLVAFPLGGTSEFMLHSYHRKSRSYESIDLTFEVDFVGVASDTVLKTYATSLERAFHLPDQRLRIVQGTEVLDDFNPKSEASGNTGFLMAPSISKPGGIKDSARSRHYEVTISLQLPADKILDYGRRSADESCVYDAARVRTVTITGQYTALGANGALATYTANNTAYCAGRLGSYGGSGLYEIIEENSQTDKEDKLCSFRVVYREIIYNQSPAALNHAAIVNPSFDYSIQSVSPGDSDPSTMRPTNITCVFDSAIDKTQTTDLEGLWEATVKPYLVDQAVAKFSLKSVAVVDSRHGFSPAHNRLRGVIQIQGYGDGTLIQCTVSMQKTYNPGAKIVEVWNGDKFGAHVYPGPGMLLRVIVDNRLSLEGGGTAGGGGNIWEFGNRGSGGGGAGSGIWGPANNAANEGAAGGGNEGLRQLFGDAAGGEGSLPDPETDGWVTISQDTVTRPVWVGIAPDQVMLTETTYTSIERYVKSAGKGGGGGDGGAPSP